jgi:hypothetical protein
LRRFLATITAAALLGVAIPAQAATVQLSDISTHWARQQIAAGVAEGYIAGYPDGSFRPDQPITRAEFFKLLGTALRLAPSQKNVDLSEVSHWSFQQGQIPAAVEAGLLNPADYGGNLVPDQTIARREIVLAAVRALGKQALVDEQNAVLNAPDAGDYQPWLRGWAAVAMGDSIVTGYEDGRVGLERNATRAEALVMVQRILAKVALQVQPAAAGDGAAHAARHSGEGEPTWTWTVPADMRPSISNGTDSVAFTEDAWGLRVLPAPGKSAWVTYAARGEGTETAGVLARIEQGKLTEVARISSQSITVLAVDDWGRAWYSDGHALTVAGTDGKADTIDGVSTPLTGGAIDWNGSLWATDSQKLFKVTAAGDATEVPLNLAAGDSITAVAATGGDQVWVLTENNGDWDHRATAIQLAGGQETRRITLLNHYNSSEQVREIAQSGPFLWTVALHKSGETEDTQDAVFKLDMTTGAFTRMLLPVTVTGARLTAAPEGGPLLQDTAGQFWRVIP